MKLVVHYGKAKTGTTSLQHALYRSRQALQDHGVLYPASRRPREDHRILTALFRTPQEMSPSVLKPFAGDSERISRAARALFEDIKRQVDRTRPKILVLSSEYFYASPTRENQERFRACLRELADDIQISVYFRDPANLYLSSVQQALRNGGRVPAPRTTVDRRNVELIESVFDQPVVAGISDPEHLVGGDIVRDFATRFLGAQISPAAFTPIRLNTTISAEAMAILDRYRNWRFPEAGRESIADSARLARRIAAIEARKGRSNKPRLRPHWAGAIRRASADLLWMRERYGLIIKGVDYAAVDGRPIASPGPRPRVEDIIEVDEAWRDEIMLEIMEQGLRLDRLRDSASFRTLPARVLRKLAAFRLS